MRLNRRGGIVARLSMIALLVLHSATAMATLTITGKNYFETKSAACSNTAVCAVKFTPVAIGKILTVRNFSCDWSSVADDVPAKNVFFSVIDASNTLLAADRFPILAVEAPGEGISRAVHHENFGAVVPAGATTIAGVNLKSGFVSFVISCTIAGTILNTP